MRVRERGNKGCNFIKRERDLEEYKSLLRDPGAIGGNKSDGRTTESLSEFGELVEELRLNDEPEVLLLVTLSVVTKTLKQLLLKMLLFVEHELGVCNKEVVLSALLSLHQCIHKRVSGLV